MKKLLLLTVFIASVICASATTFTVDKFRYYTTGTNTVTVDAYTGTAEIVTVPGTVKYGGTTYYVTCVGSWAFSGNTTLGEVILSYGITEIEEYAFQNCTNLDVVRMPGTMKTLQSDAFKGCTAGLYVYCTASTPPTCVDGPFDGAKLLRLILRRDFDSVYYPNIASISSLYKADADWKKFPQIISTANAYDYVTNEGKTTACYFIIPSSTSTKATVVGGGTQCYVPDKITINGRDYIVEEIGTQSFSSSGSVNYNITKLTGAANVTSIMESAFEGSKIQSISVPAIAEIKENAFRNCTSLTSVDLGAPSNKELDAIGKRAFYNCTALKTIQFPSYLGENYASTHCMIHIMESAFENSGLTDVLIPQIPFVIDKRAFANCKSLSNVLITTHYNPSVTGYYHDIASDAFTNINSGRNTYLYVPQASYNYYKNYAACSSFTYVYGELQQIKIAGTLVERSGTIMDGVKVDLSKSTVTLDSLTYNNLSKTFIISNCTDLRIIVKSPCQIGCKSFVATTSGIANVTIEGASDDASLIVNNNSVEWTLNFHIGGNLYIKDMPSLCVTNNLGGVMYGKSGSTTFNIDNSTGFFKGGQKAVVYNIKGLTLANTILTDCTYSSTATQYGNDNYLFSFESTLTGFTGVLKIAGVTVTAQNMAKNAIVRGVSVSRNGTITMENVNYTGNTTFISCVGTKNINIMLSGDNKVEANTFLRAESGSVTIDGGGTATLTTTGKSTSVANFFFAYGDGGESCTLSNIKRLTNTSVQAPFLGKTGLTKLTINNCSGEFKRTGSTSFAIGQIKMLTLVDTKLTNCTYRETLTQYGNSGSVKFESTLVTSNPGDVNGDDAVDITDVVNLANHVMGETPSIFVIENADVTGEGDVDVTDVVQLANRVMGV